MTTLHISPSAPSSSIAGDRRAESASLPLSGQIRADLDSLAQHMRHCASARNRSSRFQLALQDACTLASPRIVTLAAVTILLAVAAVSLSIGIFGVI